MSEIRIREQVNNILEKIDNYKQTLEAIICFSHVLRWDDNKKDFKPNSYNFIARQMDTSEKNRINSNNEVNPDLIVQLNENYGIVSEVKKSFPLNKNYWEDDFNQLIKYDDNLKGWKTSNEFIDTSDIVLLTHYKIKVNVLDFIEKKISENALAFERNFSAIAFSRVQEIKTIITLEKFYGTLFDIELDERFRLIVRVPLNAVIPLSNIIFYDDKPELSYMMEILWNKIFSQYPKREDFMESGGIKIMTINVNLDDLTNKLKFQFTDYSEDDNRQPRLPKPKWVKEAMEMFVKLKYAKKDDKNENLYIVKYKRITNTLENFAKEIIKSKNLKKVKSTLDDFF